MEIEEVKELKKKLENDVLNLIMEFERETCTYVQEMFVERIGVDKSSGVYCAPRTKVRLIVGL
jgi:superfamily II helicase